jgi:hypothetical protein
MDNSNTTCSQFRDSEMPAGSLMAQSDTPDIYDKDKEEDFSSTKAINDGEKDDTDDLEDIDDNESDALVFNSDNNMDMEGKQSYS